MIDSATSSGVRDGQVPDHGDYLSLRPLPFVSCCFLWSPFDATARYTSLRTRPCLAKRCWSPGRMSSVYLNYTTSEEGYPSVIARSLEISHQFGSDSGRQVAALVVGLGWGRPLHGA
jgi:hypothetical protein